MKIYFAALVLMGFLPTCKPQNPSAPGANHLIYIIADAPASLDPAMTADLIYYQIVFNIFETLLTVDWQTGAFKPALARRWEPDSSRLNWTFVLRHGVRFHDGSPLNAGAVKISFERQFANRRDQSAFAMVREIRAVNDSTVRFALEYPHAAFLDKLASPYYSTIASPAGLAKHKENFGRHPVGTGPFEFGRWDALGNIVLKKFPAYWNEDQPARLDSVTYKVVYSLEERIKALHQGNAGVISGLSAARVGEFYGNPKFKMVEVLSLATTILGMKLQRPPFNAMRVRQAVAYAIDKKNITVNVNRNLAIPAQGPLSPLLAYYDSTLKGFQYDAALAKTLLQNDAGDGGGISVKLGYCVESDSTRGSPTGQAIKHDLQNAGLEVSVHQYPSWQNYQAGALDGNAGELFLWAYLSFTRHPGDFLNSLFHSQSPQNFFNYKNPEVDALLERAERAPDQEQQRRLYRRVQEIVLWEAPAVFISHPKVVYATRAWVKNFSADPLGIPALKDVELENRPPQ